MKRREFISAAQLRFRLLHRATARAHAARIGVLMGVDPDAAGAQAEAAALRRGLQEHGWIEGRNLELKFGWSGAAPDLIQSAAKELVGSRCDAIVARSTPVVAALLKETHTAPIVLVVVVDPVGSGFVQNFARPGGNVTGFHCNQRNSSWSSISRPLRRSALECRPR